MALSQIQCLDNNNVNWRSSETKPEFFYSEEQRLALEALVSSGPDSFYEVIKKEKIRDFLSELEVGKVLQSLEPFDPDSGHSRSGCDKCALGGDGDKDDECGGGSGGGAEQSLEYWPDKSDCVIPELDLGWPDTVAYRGVTRATVYMQPPIDGQPHIKEVVRKMITQAQKVIAVVMDLFTDVDILKDMLDAGFKRKVSVYIILNESDVKYFLQMCERAQMHKGHLKNLRIRSIGGSEFYTRFSTKFKGCLSQKFMFVDGDKAACGSYSFTWSAARIDRNLLTVLSGQVVESFDHQFQELYLLSKAVSLKNVPMENEPEPEPVIQPAPLPAGPPQSIAKKLINPKYALVSVKSASERELKQAKVKLLKQKVEEPQIHPALLNMERANMFNYLPTWVEPEPEPGSDILGYINIIDPKVKNPMHSQMNRIKICDTANATAQFLMQTKKQEGGRSACEDTSLQVNKARHAENEEPGRSERTTARQGSREEGSATSSTKVVSPSSSFDEDLETPSLKDHKALGQPGGHNVQQPREGFASPVETHSLGSGDQGQAPVTRSGPPVPKPRTLPVTDFISMKNALNAKSITADTSKVENTIPSVNGGDAEGREEEDIEDLLIQTVPGGNDEGDTDRFGMYPNKSLSSGSGSLPPSNASSTSEEYYPTKPLQRRSSDRIPNGEHIALQRKMSDGHISRGTFAGPLRGISQSLMDMRQVENGKRRNQTLEEELKRVLSKGEPNKDRIHAMEPTKGKGLFQYSSTGPSTGLERFQTQRPSRTATKGRGKKDVPEGPGLFRQTNRKSEGHGGRPGYWSTKDLAGTFPSSLSQSLVTPDTPTTPFGIPYSKLSQAKHLKNKLGTTMDPKRRSHGPPGHKDV